MAYLIWQIEARTSVPEQITRAAEAFLRRTGTPATHLIIHHADQHRITAIAGSGQMIMESNAGSGMVNPGMFWIGTPA